ncbi:hypothetical protein DFP72DRAFT_956173 [Ephemerocybe angulata]|uniref:3'-5' exonuclease n=1 Tax=Ephemerocybe angulata TaxID=980116 RepID=A0A8H6IEE3_9AGAR|nr:hypothetical protein DFP72DRAFT_956173 [Tulosesus angulatus]
MESNTAATNNAWEPAAPSSSNHATALDNAAPNPLKRKRGRPKTKEPAFGPKRPRGRPRIHPVNVKIDPPRPRGRPLKTPSSAGGVVVSLGPRIVVPGTRPHLAPGLFGAPAPLPRSLPQTAAISEAVRSPPHPSRVDARPIQRAIPETDPERAIDVGEEEDLEDGAGGDGIGEEDDGDDEGDEGDDEALTNDEDTPPLPQRTRKPQSRLIQDEYVAILAELELRDENGLPALYAKAGEFYVRPKAPWFFLTGKRVSPTDLYRPRWFVWDPKALYKELPCPGCGKTLHRHAAMSRPRRCVDTSDSFWIVGFRYHCRHCRHPKTGKNTVTWCSWDRRILNVLPPALASHFPAILSHRSAVSKELFSWMRSCFQSGMGSKQFSDAVRVQHLLRHDELHLTYLDFIAHRSVLSSWMGQQYESFLPFDDTSPYGPHGFVPSAQWFRDMYDQYMEEHRQDIDQHTAMLTAEICAIDHSHKLPKHIARAEGERVVNGLLSVTNEKGEIRACNLVSTKAHSQFELALTEIRKSLDKYGHKQPELFYTDNMADKAFLEASFPSLRRGVVAVEQFGHLDPFTLPSDVQICVRKEEQAMNAALSTIIEHVPIESSDPDLVLGFDCEWNLAISSNGHHERGDIAVVQIAFEQRVYILQISDLIARHRLPEKLIMLLQNPRVLKVGRMVKNDLKQLEDAIGATTPFVGALDLASYAKARHAVSNARCSLSQLCAVVLQKRLSKNVSERLSTAWEQPHLTPEQEHYAACDAYAPLLIYQELSKLSVPIALPDSPLPSTPVLIFSSDNTVVIAHGRLPVDQSASQYDNINITPTRILVEITEVIVPAAIISTHKKRALSDFGPPNFLVVCPRGRVKVYDPFTFGPQPAGTSEAATGAETDETETAGLPPVADSSGTRESEAASSESLDNSEPSPDGTGVLLRHSLGLEGEEDGTPNDPATAHPRNIDLESQTYGYEVLRGPAASPSTWSTILRSRVLKDVFHVFNMLRLSTTHGLRKAFGRALRDILFVPDLEDRLRISAWASRLAEPKTFEQLLASMPNWLWRRCRRQIPPPDILYPLVEELFLAYGPLKDATTDQPLFNQQAWKTSKQILELIRQGYVSDPPGIALYTVIGVDAKAGNLPIYRCSRGTNFTEGGVHTHLRARLPTSGASIRHVNACLSDFVLQHNLRVGTFNSTGQPYRGHFSIWLTNRLQERLTFLDGIIARPMEMQGWVNGNLYLPTTERLGILPIPEDVRLSSGIAAGSVVLSPGGSKSKIPHAYLARMQGTRKAILPVHTDEEKALFRALMASNPAFNSRTTGPTWKLAVKVWNEHAETSKHVYYKLVEQLKSYFTTWTANLSVVQTLSMTSLVRNPITAASRAISRSTLAPSMTDRPLTLHAVHAGFNTPALRTSLPVPPSEPAEQNSGVSSITAPQAQTPPEPSPVISTPTPGSSLIPHESIPVSVADALARQRVSDEITQIQHQPQNGPTEPRKPRTCAKCGILAPPCPGRQRRQNCRNPCQDCTKLDCYGRNARRPDKKCDEGWLGVARPSWP